jgi:hypothetical protein
MFNFTFNLFNKTDSDFNLILEVPIKQMRNETFLFLPATNLKGSLIVCFNYLNEKLDLNFVNQCEIESNVDDELHVYGKSLIFYLLLEYISTCKRNNSISPFTKVYEFISNKLNYSCLNSEHYLYQSEPINIPFLLRSDIENSYADKDYKINVKKMANPFRVNIEDSLRRSNFLIENMVNCSLFAFSEKLKSLWAVRFTWLLERCSLTSAFLPKISYGFILIKGLSTDILDNFSIHLLGKMQKFLDNLASIDCKVLIQRTFLTKFITGTYPKNGLSLSFNIMFCQLISKCSQLCKIEFMRNLTIKPIVIDYNTILPKRLIFSFIRQASYKFFHYLSLVSLKLNNRDKKLETNMLDETSHLRGLRYIWFNQNFELAVYVQYYFMLFLKIKEWLLRNINIKGINTLSIVLYSDNNSLEYVLLKM